MCVILDIEYTYKERKVHLKEACRKQCYVFFLMSRLNENVLIRGSQKPNPIFPQGTIVLGSLGPTILSFDNT